MIRDGLLTYSGAQSTLRTWEPSNEVARNILIALVTTLLSYQAAAICADLLFGLKPRGVATAHDIQFMLLMRRNSPMAVAKALFPQNVLRRLRHRRRRLATSSQEKEDVVREHDEEKADEDDESSLHETQAYFRLQLFLKFIFVLAFAPLLNMTAIALTVEYDTFVSFKEARFGGVTLGLDIEQRQPLQKRLLGGLCESYPLTADVTDTVLVEFVTCTIEYLNLTGAAWLPPPGPSRPLGVSVVELAQHSVTVSLMSPASDLVGQKFAKFYNITAVDSGGRVTASVRSGFSNATAEKLVDYGIELLAKGCLDNVSNVRPAGPIVPSFQSQNTSTKLFSCTWNGTSADFVAETLDELLSRVTLVDSPSMELVEEILETEDELDRKVVVIDKQYLLRRRRSLLSVLILVIILPCIVSLRLLVAVVTRNDLGRALGLIVRNDLRLPCCDSMLPYNTVVARSAISDVNA